MEKIYSVTDTDLALEKSIPPHIFLSATGMTSSNGWKNPELSPVVYVTPPDDCIQEFEFVAQEPVGNVLPYLAPVCASIAIEAPE